MSFPFPSQIARYVTARTLTSVAGALLVLSALIVLANFVELSRSIGGKNEAGTAEVFGLALLEAPTVILLVMPFAFLFGVLFAFMNLNRRSELIALRAAGVSAWRFVMPAAVAAAVIGVIATTVANPIASRMTTEFERVKSQIQDGPDTAQDKLIWLRQGDRRRQIVIRAKSSQGPGLHLKGVTMFVDAVEPDGRLRFLQRIEASDAVLKGRTWTLTGVREFTPGGLANGSTTLTVGSTLTEQMVQERLSRASNATPFWSLPGLIAQTEAAGASASAYRLQYHQLLAAPLMYAAMSILAAAFSLRLLRLGGLAQFAGAGVGLGFVFFFFNELSKALGRSDVLPPALAAWAPPALALLVGITLLTYAEDG